MARFPDNLLTTITLLTIALFTPGKQLFAAEAKIAVAANFTNSCRQLGKLFESTTDHTVLISYGSTGKLYSQIENGAPFDIFLGADVARPEKAEKEGLAVKDSLFIYASGKLVLWSADPKLTDLNPDWLKTTNFRRAAIANPKTAPYGLAAKQTLQHLGIWDDIQKKLVRGDSAAQTYQFVATGNAELGFVALSQVKAWKGKPGSLWAIPADYYRPIDQAAVLLKKGQHNPAALAFLEFLQSDSARELIVSYGYDLPLPTNK